jgi:hypothetical protein
MFEHHSSNREPIGEDEIVEYVRTQTERINSGRPTWLSVPFDSGAVRAHRYYKDARLIGYVEQDDNDRRCRVYVVTADGGEDVFRPLTLERLAFTDAISRLERHNGQEPGLPVENIVSG